MKRTGNEVRRVTVAAATIMALATTAAMVWAGIPPLSFAAFVNVPLGPPGCTANVDCSEGALDVTAGDFNNDGHLDIATANNGSDDITVFLGNGSGGLTYKFTGAAPAGPAGIAAGNLNEGTVLDLVVSKEMSNNIGVFIGNGDGTFQDEVEYDMGGSPEAVVLADFNGDGNLDVATADLFPDPITGDSTVSVRLGTGHGTFGDRMVTVMDGDPFGMAVGRVDAGDTLDLVVSLYSNGQVVTLLGDGTGHFTLAQPADVNLGPRGVALADYNGDGMLDVAVTTECEDILDVLFGNGDGTFQTPTPYGVGGLPESVVAGDFNGDGIIDLATADAFGTIDFDGDVSILVGQGGGAFADAQQFEVDLGPYGLVAADLNGDRLPDLITANLDSDPPTVSTLRNTGTPPTPSCVGDCNGDGMVLINELVLGVNIALGSTPVSACPAFDANGNGMVLINELISGVNNALAGCPMG